MVISVPPGRSLAPLELWPQRPWARQGASPCSGPLTGAPGTPAALGLTQPPSPLVFAASSAGISRQEVWLKSCCPEPFTQHRLLKLLRQIRIHFSPMNKECGRRPLLAVAQHLQVTVCISVFLLVFLSRSQMATSRLVSQLRGSGDKVGERVVPARTSLLTGNAFPQMTSRGRGVHPPGKLRGEGACRVDGAVPGTLSQGRSGLPRLGPGSARSRDKLPH